MYTATFIPVQHRYVPSENGPLHALDFGGAGRPVVMLHGVTGTAWVWHDVARDLGRRAVAVDLRGHGDSAWSSEHRYDTDAHVMDLGRQIDALGVDDVDLVGSSWGALVALEWTVANPGRVRHLALVDIEPSFEQSDTDLMPRPHEFDSYDAARAWFAQTNPRAPQSALDAMTFGSMRRNKTGAIVPKHDPMFFDRWPFRNGDHWSCLPKLTCPTLMVHAGFTFVRGEVMKDMNSQVADSTLVEIAESGHVVPLDNPTALTGALRPFLES